MEIGEKTSLKTFFVSLQWLQKKNVSYIHIAVPNYCRSNLSFLEIGNKK